MKGFGGGGMQAKMRQANQMQTRMKNAQDELAAREFETTAGGRDLLQISEKLPGAVTQVSFSHFFGFLWL